MRAAPALLALVLASVALGATTNLRANEQRAVGVALFEEARKLAAEGRFAAACPKFEEAFSLMGGVGVAFNLADCWEQTGRIASAWGMFGKAAALAKDKKDAEREKLSVARAEALEKRLPKLVVRTAADTPGLEVRVGALRLGAGSLGAKLPVDPGSVVLRATAPGRQAWSQTLSLAEKEEREIVVPELGVQAAPQPPPPSASAPLPRDGGPQRAVGLALGASGLGGLAIGAVLGGVAVARYQDSLGAGCDALSRCPLPAAKIRDEARAAGDASTALFVLGAAALAAGFVVFFAAPTRPDPKRATVHLTPGGLGGTLP